MAAWVFNCLKRKRNLSILCKVKINLLSNDCKEGIGGDLLYMTLYELNSFLASLLLPTGRLPKLELMIDEATMPYLTTGPNPLLDIQITTTNIAIKFNIPK